MTFNELQQAAYHHAMVGQFLSKFADEFEKENAPRFTYRREESGVLTLVPISTTNIETIKGGDARHERAYPNAVNLDNLIESNAESFFESKQEEKEFMRLNKGVRLRKDGRYEWRQMINGVRHSKVHSNPRQLAEIVREFKKTLYKDLAKPQVKESTILIDLCTKYVTLYKGSDVKYTNALKHLKELTKPIRQYKKGDIQALFNKLSHLTTTANYCWFIIKNVFADALADGIIKINPIANMKTQVKKGTVGEWIDLSGQRTIKDNLDKCKIGNEILFYLLTGCRWNEAFDTTINFDKGTAFIDGTKTNNAPRHMKLSKKFCDYFRDKWAGMFKLSPDYYSRQTTFFLRELGIKDKSLHDLRHSYSTNIYYLGVDPKRHQYLMGHKNIKLTYDVYTSFDPNITKQDILDIWGDWYPSEF